MNATSRRDVVLVGLLLLVSLAFADWHQLNSGVVGPLYSVHFPEGTQVGYAVGAGVDSLGGGDVGLVIKTTDGGATWVSRVAEGTRALRSVYFKDDSTGFAVGDAGTIIRTGDGGASWAAMAVPDTDDLTRVQFPENTMTGYIGVHPDSGAKVLKTTDGGDNWISVALGGPMARSYSCGMATDSTGVAVGYEGWVYGTLDGFGNRSAPQGPQTIADLVAAAFSPTDPNLGYLIGHDSIQGIIRYTEDGGATLWDSVSCRRATAFYGVAVPIAEAAYVCGDSMGRGVILRSVSAHDFYRTTVPIGMATLYGLCFPNGRDTGYAVGARGVILRTYDGGIPLGGG